MKTLAVEDIKSLDSCNVYTEDRIREILGGESITTGDFLDLATPSEVSAVVFWAHKMIVVVATEGLDEAALIAEIFSYIPEDTQIPPHILAACDTAAGAVFILQRHHDWEGTDSASDFAAIKAYLKGLIA